MKIKTKIILLTSLFVVVLVVAVTAVTIFSIRGNAENQISDFRHHELKRIKSDLEEKLNIVYSLVQSTYEDANSAPSQQTLDELKKSIANMRFDNGDGYFWITTSELPYPRMILDPMNPKRNGLLLRGHTYEKTTKGENLYTASSELVKKQRKGFINYEVRKTAANGNAEILGKTAFVKVFKPLGWIVSTSTYTGQVDKAVSVQHVQNAKKLNKLIIKISSIALGVLVASILASFIFAQTISGAIIKLTNAAYEISLGRGLEDKIENTARTDEIGQLAKSIERLQTSVKIMMKRIKKK